jgi:serine protease Do
MGIGFAIPSNMARSVMNSLVKHGKVVRGWLGVSIQEVSPDLAKEFGVSNASGALVADVLDDSPASKARLDRGDIITAVNGTVIRDPVQLRSLVADTIPGTEVTVSLVRDKKPMDVKITVGELPKEVAQAGRRESGSGTGSHALAGVTVEDAASHAERERRSHKRTGVVVTDIEPDSPAERAGLRVGDVIREINRKPIKSIGDFERMTRELSPKSAILVLLSRGNATIFLSIQPGT